MVKSVTLGEFPFWKLGIIRAPFETVASASHRWLADIANITSSISSHEIKRELAPLTLPVPTKRIVAEVSNDVCLMVDNGVRGTDPVWLQYIGKEINADTIFLMAMGNPSFPKKIDILPPLGAFAFNYRGGNGARRSVYCVNEGTRWSFEALGTPLACENQSEYSKRRIRERLGGERIETIVSTMFGVEMRNLTLLYRRATLFEVATIHPAVRMEYFSEF